VPLNCSRLLSAALSPFALSVGLADIIPISSSQQSSFSGDASICDVNPFPCAPDSPFDSFTGPGQATVSVPGQGSVFFEAFGGSGFIHIEVDGPAAHAQADVTATYDSTEVFKLTSPYLLHLAGTVGLFGGGILDLFNVSTVAQITLTGPNFQFVESCSSGTANVPCFQSFDTMLTLDPGIYTLNQNEDASLSSSLIFGSAAVEAHVSLNAFDFTAIPEPLGAPFFSLLLMAILICVARRSNGFQKMSRESSNLLDPHC